MYAILFVLLNLVNGNYFLKCDPLVLTPFIESNRLDKAKELSFVKDLNDFQEVRSYSGFFTVNKKYDSNLFFWFFPAQHKPKIAPVLLWLQGGPGTSSMSGLFQEHGPFHVLPNLQLVRNEYSWTKVFSIIYIDNPVGTGFSYTMHSEGYARNETQIADELYEGLQQFFKLFSEYRNNEFYVTGESYAGKYIPALGFKLHRMSHNSNINFKGIAIGSGWIDPISQFHPGPLLYQIGLIDDNQLKHFIEAENKFTVKVQQKNYLGAYNLYMELLGNDIGDSPSYFKNVTGSENLVNFLQTKETPEFYPEYLNKINVQSAIHVGCPRYSSVNLIVNDYLMDDFCASVKPWFRVLVNNYKVLLFNGLLDIEVPNSSIENLLKNLVWKYSEEYFHSKRIIWRMDDQVVGYVKTVTNFTRVVIRNAGHSVPLDQPKVAFEMIKRFIYSHF